MKISFNKISSPTSFKFENDGLIFEGELKRKSDKLVACEGVIRGVLAHNCDKCGADIELNLNERVDLTFSDGVWEDDENALSDTIEFFDGAIDLGEVLNGEIEAFKSDYFYCEKCKF